MAAAGTGIAVVSPALPPPPGAKAGTRAAPLLGRLGVVNVILRCSVQHCCHMGFALQRRAQPPSLLHNGSVPQSTLIPGQAGNRVMG